MLLSKKTSIKVSREYANLIGHMCYAASKLWNVCNYERQHYKETGIEQHPDWYYQKKAHKEELVDIIGERLSQLPVKQLGKIRTADREDPLQIRQT